MNDDYVSLNDIINMFKKATNTDFIIGRVVPVAVPKEMVDQAVVSAALSMVADNPVAPGPQYKPIMIKAGAYQISIVVLIHPLDKKPDQQQTPPKLVN